MTPLLTGGAQEHLIVSAGDPRRHRADGGCGSRRGGPRGFGPRGTEFAHKMNSVGGAGSDGCPALEMHSIPLNHTLKNGYDDRSYVYLTQ